MIVEWHDDMPQTDAEKKRRRRRRAAPLFVENGHHCCVSIDVDVTTEAGGILYCCIPNPKKMLPNKTRVTTRTSLENRHAWGTAGALKSWPGPMIVGVRVVFVR